jgi:hypothetical protein
MDHSSLHQQEGMPLGEFASILPEAAAWMRARRELREFKERGAEHNEAIRREWHSDLQPETDRIVGRRDMLAQAVAMAKDKLDCAVRENLLNPKLRLLASPRGTCESVLISKAILRTMRRFDYEAGIIEDGDGSRQFDCVEIFLPSPGGAPKQEAQHRAYAPKGPGGRTDEFLWLAMFDWVVVKIIKDEGVLPGSKKVLLDYFHEAAKAVDPNSRGALAGGPSPSALKNALKKTPCFAKLFERQK